MQDHDFGTSGNAKFGKMPHTAAGTALCSEFSFLEIPYDSFFFVPNVSTRNVGNSSCGTATTLCARPLLKQQSSKQKQKQDSIKPHFQWSCWLSPCAFCSRNLRHTSASHHLSGSLSWFTHNCKLLRAHVRQVTSRGSLVVICSITCRTISSDFSAKWPCRSAM